MSSITIRSMIATSITVLALGAAGCAPTSTGSTAQPGDGPATSSSSSASASTQEESTATETETPADQTTANFKEKFVYADGVEVEITKLSFSKVSDVGASEEMKQGSPTVQMAIRIRNGSEATLESVDSTTMTYGDDGDEAPQLFDGVKYGKGVNGKILPGKSKTGYFAYGLPTSARDNVTLEFTPDFEHDAAVFTGSVK